MGQTTQRFFDDGERHEAAEWADTVLPLDDEPEMDPATEFESFDKIPRRKGPVIAVITLGVFLVLGIGVGLMAALKTGRSVQKSVAEFLGTTSHSVPAAPATPVTESPSRPSVQAVAPAIVPPQDQPVPPPAIPPAQVAPVPAQASQPSPAPAAPASSGARSAKPDKAPVVTPLPATPEKKPVRHPKARPHQNYVWSASANALVPAEPEASDVTSKKSTYGATRKTRPLRDYVWSATANALVPADSAVEVPNDGGGMGGSAKAAERPSGKTGAGSGGLHDRDATIAPPTTGDGPRERPASINPPPAKKLKPSPFVSP